MGSGTNWLLGGLVAAIAVPALAFGLHLPFLLACAIAAAAGGGVALATTRRRPFEGMEGSGIGRGRIEFARELLTDAYPLVDRIQAAAKAIRTPAVGERVKHLAAMASHILDGVEKDPMKIDPVRRFITYYLPRAAEMTEAYSLLEQQLVPRPDRLSAVREAIDRLDQAFTRYADSLVEADLGSLDIELKLLKSSLDEDVGPAIAPPTLPSMKH